MRYFIRFSYFGKPYHGWQRQPNAITVQQVLDEALSTLLKHHVETLGAGRTDTGVHAREMYAHFDCDIDFDADTLVFRLNALLPKAIAVRRIFQVADDAHARFDAIARTYEYWVTQQKNPFLTDAVHYVAHPLDVTGMNDAAKLLLKHDEFECFSKSNTDVKTYRCNISEAYWEEQRGLLVFTITADRFLRNMVRAIVGTLLEIGRGKWTHETLQTILADKDRSKAGPSVPAKGLYLTSVRYPEKITGPYG